MGWDGGDFNRWGSRTGAGWKIKLFGVVPSSFFVGRIGFQAAFNSMDRGSLKKGGGFVVGLGCSFAFAPYRGAGDLLSLLRQRKVSKERRP